MLVELAEEERFHRWALQPRPPVLILLALLFTGTQVLALLVCKYAVSSVGAPAAPTGTHFTCFTGTKVQKLTLQLLSADPCVSDSGGARCWGGQGISGPYQQPARRR
jgi:hypothetical protein